MDLSRAQLEPFRALHYFHEQLNIHVKSSTAGVVLLANAAGNSTDPKALGRLIEQVHPAWNSSPIHELSIDLYKRVYCAVGAYALVSLFSALDDFIVGLEADIARYEHSSGQVVPKFEVRDEAGEEPLLNTYVRFGWDVAGIAELIPVLRYFRLMRNCVAHRSSRASKALSEHSKSESLRTAIAGLLERNTRAAPEYEHRDEIFVDPTLSICCSDTIRTVAADCNRAFVRMMSEKGFLLLACGNLKKRNSYGTAAYKSPEAVLNLGLVERYRVGLSDRYEAPKKAREFGLWKDFYDSFEANRR